MTDKRRYTESDDASIRAWRAEGEPLGVIAQRLGRSLDAVKRRASLIGATAPARALTPEEIAKIHELWRGGMTLSRIASRMHRNSEVIAKVVAARRAPPLGITSPPRGSTAEPEVVPMGLPDLSALYYDGERARRYEDDPRAVRPFCPVRIGCRDALGGLREAKAA